VKISEAQEIAAQVGKLYVERFGITPDAAFHLGKLTEEMGELQAEWLRLNGRARGQGSRAALEDEAADVLGFLLLFADWQGIDLAAAFRRKWAGHLAGTEVDKG
jgi:NTP pyrophosphatase (non-canonical NTP hydrolase)